VERVRRRTGAGHGADQSAQAHAGFGIETGKFEVGRRDGSGPEPGHSLRISQNGTSNSGPISLNGRYEAKWTGSGLHVIHKSHLPDTIKVMTLDLESGGTITSNPAKGAPDTLLMLDTESAALH